MLYHTCRVGSIVVFVALVTACQQAPRSVLGPSASGGATLNLESSGDSVQWGAIEQGVMHSAANDSGFLCLLAGVPAEQSHATISNSGNETLECSGQTPARPDQALHFEGFPCPLHFGDGDPLTPDVTTDSRAVVTPSGHATLVCKSKG